MMKIPKLGEKPQNFCVSPVNQEIPGFLVLVLTAGCLRGAGLYVPYPKVE